MGTNAVSQAVDNTDRFYTQVKSVNKFDELEVKPVIDGLLSTKEEEICFIGTYHRARCHVDTALLLQNVRHFQAAAMIARSLFELAVDMRLLEIVPLGWMKMLAFVDVERLRCANKIVAFGGSNAAFADVSACKALIADRRKAIDTKRQALWPNLKKVELVWSSDGVARQATRRTVRIDLRGAIPEIKLVRTCRSDRHRESQSRDLCTHVFRRIQADCAVRSFVVAVTGPKSRAWLSVLRMLLELVETFLRSLRCCTCFDLDGIS
jgi:hypothetical protein